MTEEDPDALHRSAYDHFDAGRLDAAAAAFARLGEIDPDYPPYAYMLGLAHKYRRDWPASLAANLRSQSLRGEIDEASVWNAGIAATALGDMAEARRQWASLGIDVPASGEANFGDACVRLDPWAGGEVVWVRRIGPCHARILNVPFPESGWRYGDVVLHDGAATGRRRTADGREVGVFNAMQRLQRSDFATWTVFVTAADAEALAPLMAARAPDLGHVEDWTGGVRMLCRRCSYGVSHVHDDRAPGAWAPERTLGIAARSRGVVERLLDGVRSGRLVVDAIDGREGDVSAPTDGQVWWNGDDADDTATSSGDG